MDEEKYRKWRESCKKEVISQIILNHLKKKKLLKKEEIKKIEKKINFIGYKNFLNSPHLEGKEELKKKAFLICLNDYHSSVSFTKKFSFR